MIRAAPSAGIWYTGSHEKDHPGTERAVGDDRAGVSSLLGADSPPGEMSSDTGCLRVSADVTCEGLWGSCGSWLEGAAEFLVAPSAARGGESRNGDAASIAELGNANSYPNRQY